MTSETADDFDLLSPETISCPFHANQILRKQKPVYLVPSTDIYYVSTHSLVKEALKRTDDFSSRFMAEFEGDVAADEEIQTIIRKGRGWPERDALLTNDPPQHARFRGLVSEAFSKKRVDLLTPRISAIANQLIDQFVDSGQCEFVRAFAIPMPLKVIAELLAFEDDQLDLLRRWSDAFADRLSGMASRERLIECTHTILEYQHHMSDKIEGYRKAPEDNLVSDLVHARIGGERSLDMSELLTICHELLLAGNETTANALSEGMLLLLRNPIELKKVIKNRELIPNMVEEILRCSSPVHSILRIVTRDTVLGGAEIPQGSKLMLRYISANRDEQVFEDPERFKVDRADVNRHIAFGEGGRHVCIGLMLARRELNIAYEQLFNRLRPMRISLDEDKIEYMSSMILRGIKQLPIRFESVG